MKNNKNMVDEKFELAALIFRLTGREENGYNSKNELRYQKEVGEKFAEYEKHETVEYAKTLPIGHDAVFKFAVHIEKKGEKFVFIEDVGSLFDGRWDDGKAQKFLPLFNKFYEDTNYSEFYTSYTSYFEELTQKFIDKIYGKVDFEWFEKYIDTSNFRCIISPSIIPGGFGATVNDKIVYCASEYGMYELIIEEYYNNNSVIVDIVNGGKVDYFFAFVGSGAIIIHEYCHSFANPLADKVYQEDSEFKKWCDNSVDLDKNRSYNNGSVMAREYLTRAYTILYYKIHDYELPICDKIYKYSEFLSFEKERENGFPYIEEVYKMILESEKK